jgi:hypothetical protein
VPLAVLSSGRSDLIGQVSHDHGFSSTPGPLNPGNPYIGSKTENGFGTFGPPDIAATLVSVAGKAIREIWYQKWWVHLRHRPESGGAILYLQKTGQCGTIEGHVSDTVLNSPTHPAYPTGHGIRWLTP